MNGVERISNIAYPAGKAAVTKCNDKVDKDYVSFGRALENAQSKLNVRLSKHARARMYSRNIALDRGQVERLNRAVDQAKAKGIRDTLVLLDDKAFVVNVKSTIIVTASDQGSLKEKIFTNIDGAVIV
jgi:flagellar operon protein